MSRLIRFVMAALVAGAGVFVFLPSGYVSASGLVVNHSFEWGEAGVPYWWNLTGNASRVDTLPRHEGNWTARVTGEGDVLTMWVADITPFVTYESWGWMSVSGNVTGVIAFDFWLLAEGAAIQLSPTRMLFATDTNGTYVQGTDVLGGPVGTTHLRIRLLGMGWNPGAEVRFDQIGVFPVTGLCFIATAAYGTETASQLDTLRDFRDQVLLGNALGARFVATYYRLSPPVAAFIARNDFLRTVVREMLIGPVVGLLQWSQDLWRAVPEGP